MNQPNTTPQDNAGRARETAEARAELLRLAEEQGVRPLSFDELLGDATAGDPEKEDPDDFAELRREWRKDELARSRK